jgi:hypothetical protein
MYNVECVEVDKRGEGKTSSCDAVPRYKDRLIQSKIHSIISIRSGIAIRKRPTRLKEVPNKTTHNSTDNKKMIIPSPRSATPARLVLLGCVLCLLRLLPATSIAAEEVCSVSPDSVSIGHCGILNDTTWSYYTARVSIPPDGGECLYAWEVWRKARDGSYSESWSIQWVKDASNPTQASEFMTPVDPNCTDSCEVIVQSPFRFEGDEPKSFTVQHRFNAYFDRDGEETPPTDDDWPFRSLSDDERVGLPSWSLTVTEDSCTYTKGVYNYTKESNSGGVRASGVLAAAICLIVVALQSTL